MKLFGWLARRSTPDPTLLDLYERQRRLEVDMRALERAQTENFDSVRRVLAKVRRVQRSNEADGSESLQDAPESTNGHSEHLTAKEQFRLNQLARRR